MKVKTIKEIGFANIANILLENERIFEFGNGLWKGKKEPFIKVKVLRNTNFNNDGTLSFDDVAELDVELKQFSNRRLIKEDILLERSGGGPEQPVGRVVFFEQNRGDYSFSNFTTRIRVTDVNKIKPKYLLYYLLYFYQNGGTYDLQQRTTGIRNLNFSDYKKISIPLLELCEQGKITSVLSKIQQAIEHQDKIIQITKELKKSLMNKLFTEGLHSEEQKETEIGLMPKSCEVVTLGEICEYTTGKLNSEAAKEDGIYPFFTCSQETFKIDSYSFDREALLLAGNNARGIYSVKYYKGKFDVYQRTYVITIRDAKKVDYIYLSYDLTRKLDFLRENSLGSTTKYLTAGIITGLGISLPSIEEQKEIANILLNVDKKITQAETRKQALKSLFKTMLNQLMTGRIRVKDMDFKEAIR